MFKFNPETKHDTGGSLIPANVLTFATFKVQKLRQSNNTGGTYADIELILQGQYENRRVFDKIPDPADGKNSEKWRQMGMASLQHALEAAGIFDPANPDSYNRFANGGFVDILKALDGKRVAFKVGIEKGTDGHQDRNRVITYLSPNPVSSTNKQYQELLAGGGQQTTAPQQTSAFGQAASAGTAPQRQPAAAAAGNSPNWLDAASDDDVPF